MTNCDRSDKDKNDEDGNGKRKLGKSGASDSLAKKARSDIPTPGSSTPLVAPGRLVRAVSKRKIRLLLFCGNLRPLVVSGMVSFFLFFCYGLCLFASV